MLIICTWCEKESEKPDREIKRQLKKGRTIFFCCISHVAKYYNLRKKNHPIKKNCKLCGIEFPTVTGSKERDFCSRSHASKGSMTELRKRVYKDVSHKSRENLISVDETLRKRENWKYKKIIELLDRNNIKYEFEYRIKPYIYDLALFEKKIFIEFDGKYHFTEKEQKQTDRKKDELARKNNWKIIRIPVQTNVIIDPGCLYKYIV